MIFHIEKIPRTRFNNISDEENEKHNQIYTQLEKLGKGSYGSVYKIIDHETQKIFALKRIIFQETNKGIRYDALREITFLSQLKHPNLLSIHKYFIYPNKVEMYIDYCQIDLSHFIALCKYNEKTLKMIMYQLILGINFLHSHMLMHRDLKPSNIFLNVDTMEIKIGDFGLSRKFELFLRPYTLEVSTIGYRAPELIAQNAYYLIGIDTWSVGCILAEMIMKRRLIEGHNEMEELIKIRDLFGEFSFEISEGVTLITNNDNNYNDVSKKKKLKNLKQYIKKKAAIEVSDDCYDLIEKLLVVDPNQRIYLQEALQHVSNFNFKIFL